MAISISVIKTLFPCDDNDHRMLRRRYDSTLLLAAILRVDVSTTIINTTNLKSPTHVPVDSPDRKRGNVV